MTTVRPWKDIVIPPSVDDVPAQIAREEKQYLIWLAESAYTGQGALIELGTLLGGSSCALAEGLRRSGSRQRIVAMDHFLWWGDEFRPEGVADGDDFMSHYENNVRPYADSLDVRRVDLTEAVYDGEPIEILFVDAAKSWGLLNATLRAFGPHLISGKSRVVFQDFRYLAYWIQLVMDSRPDLWEQVEETERAFTVTFRPKAAETLAWCAAADFSDGDFPWESASRSFERRIASASPENADRYRFAAMVKALVELEFAACSELVEQVPASDRRDDGIRRAAVRGTGLLRERLLRDPGTWKTDSGDVLLTRLRNEIERMPEPFKHHLQAVDRAMTGR